MKEYKNNKKESVIHDDPRAVTVRLNELIRINTLRFYIDVVAALLLAGVFVRLLFLS